LQTLLTNLIPLLTVALWVIAVYLLLLWAASVLWTYRDIRARSEDVVVQVLAVSLALLLPFAGLILHVILRPRQTLSEKYERALEEQYLRRDLEEPYVCPHCQRGIEHDFIVCPHCHTSLRRRCVACDRVVDLTWSICPYCGDDGSGAVLRPGYRTQTQQIDLYDR
jgi:RNA polymerase subunit RPABC4/transcription elongation factor Spt4